VGNETLKTGRGNSIPIANVIVPARYIICRVFQIELYNFENL
jgi:hypothetical protein